ncbi:MAG: hypothetical protein ACK5LT_11045 [Lachnospirales bacterium]
MEFSKKLAISIVAVFIGTWFLAWASWFTKEKIPMDMLEFINIPLSIIITGYFSKSGYENGTKICQTERINNVLVLITTSLIDCFLITNLIT